MKNENYFDVIWSFRWYVVLFLIVIVIAVILVTSAEFALNNDQLKRVCLERGYSEMIIADDVSFCVRLVDGNTEVISVERLVE